MFAHISSLLYICSLIDANRIMKQTWTKYIKWLLPVLFILYYSDISLFIHVHIQDGTTIVHSHPFASQSDGFHHHKSLSELQLFHTLSSVSVEDGAVHSLFLQFYATPVACIAEALIYADYLISAKGDLSLRAPPSLFC